MLLADDKGAELIVAVGTHATLVEFLDKGRAGMASTFLTRLRVGGKLVDAKGVSRLYRSRISDLVAGAAGARDGRDAGRRALRCRPPARPTRAAERQVARLHVLDHGTDVVIWRHGCAGGSSDRLPLPPRLHHLRLPRPGRRHRRLDTALNGVDRRRPASASTARGRQARPGKTTINDSSAARRRPVFASRSPRRRSPAELAVAVMTL